jgi:hypothetical protein
MDWISQKSEFNSGTCKRFSSPEYILVLWPTQWVPRALSVGVKWLELEGKCLSPFSHTS